MLRANGKQKDISQVLTSVWERPIKSSAERPVPAEGHLSCSCGEFGLLEHKTAGLEAVGHQNI